MIQNIENGYVKVETEHGITTIEFYHPQSNSLPARILQELAVSVSSAGASESTRVIVLKSAGSSVFCAGASFDELYAIKNEEEGKKFFMGFAELINAMRKCPKLIIGRIQGKCIGGGVGLAAAVDYCIAWKEVDIRLSELAIGIGPFVVGPAVERKIGTSAFSQLATDAKLSRNSEWAKKKGLFAEVHESIENMDDSVARLATSLSQSHPEAMKEMKKMFWKGTEHWDELLRDRAAISGRLILSEYSRKALESARAKLVASN